MADSSPEKPKLAYWWERPAILFALATLWPGLILRWEGLLWKILMFVALALMIVIFVIRVRRIRRIAKDPLD